MKYTLLILSFLLSTYNTSKPIVDKSTKHSYEFIQSKHFELRNKPILNREYVLFLCWNLEVYGSSSPNKIEEIFPKDALDDVIDFAYGIDEIFRIINPNSVLKNYILNPKYLDYPLIGLSEFQVMELESWLSDRYNEAYLIKKEYLNYNRFQKDEDSFNTETLLIEQYLGSVKNEFSLDWEAHQFKANFRLPYKTELGEVLKKESLNNNLIEYSFDKNDFLWLWNQEYITFNQHKTILTLNLPYDSITIDNFKTPKDLLSATYTPAVLSDKSKEFINTQYIKDTNAEPYPYPEKEFDGRMKFVVVGTNDKGKAITANRFEADKNKSLDNKIFRIAANSVLEEMYLS